MSARARVCLCESEVRLGEVQLLGSAEVLAQVVEQEIATVGCRLSSVEWRLTTYSLVIFITRLILLDLPNCFYLRC